MSDRGRGPLAVADMRARLLAGWDTEMLWARMKEAELGEGYEYDYAPQLDLVGGGSVED